MPGKNRSFVGSNWKSGNTLISHAKLRPASAASLREYESASCAVWCSRIQVESQTPHPNNAVNELIVRKIVSEPGEVCIPAGANLPGIRKCTFGNLKKY